MKNIIYKILPVSIHVIVWVIFIIFPMFFLDDFRSDLLSAGRLTTLVIVLLFFYLNYFLLIPELLFKRKFVVYFLIVLASLTIVFAFFFYAGNLFFNFNEIKNIPKFATERSVETKRSGDTQDVNGEFEIFISERKDRINRRRSSVATSSLLVALLLSSFIRISQEWYKTEEKRKESLNEKLKSELSFLKSQINPHFLFNTLNGIYSLSLKKSDKTPGAILKLSELMRHMLIESGSESIPIEKEIEFLENYIELQKLRLPSEAHIVLNVIGKSDNLKIQPLLLISFVENAFKHGNIFSNTYINIELLFKENELTFKANNKISTSSEKDENSGIGLENVKKRLELLYPDQYILKYWELNGIYTTILIIKL